MIIVQPLERTVSDTSTTDSSSSEAKDVLLPLPTNNPGVCGNALTSSVNAPPSSSSHGGHGPSTTGNFLAQLQERLYFGTAYHGHSGGVGSGGGGTKSTNTTRQSSSVSLVSTNASTPAVPHANAPPPEDSTVYTQNPEDYELGKVIG